MTTQDGNEGCEQGHKHKNGKQLVAEHLALLFAYVKTDELDETFSVHQESEGDGLADGNVYDEGGDDGASNLAEAGIGDDEGK